MVGSEELRFVAQPQAGYVVKTQQKAGGISALVISAGPANADFVFGKPVNLGPVLNTAWGEGENWFSVDGLECYFSSDRPGGLVLCFVSDRPGETAVTILGVEPAIGYGTQFSPAVQAVLGQVDQTACTRAMQPMSRTTGV